MALAAEALIWILGEDPRVQRAYAEWRAARGLHGDMSVDAFAAAIRAYPEDLARLEQLCEDLGLSSWEWLPGLLLLDFRVTVVGQAMGDTLAVRITPDGKRLSGRRPKGGGKHIPRDVRWFYRRKVKQPPDSVSQLAREHKQLEQRHVDPRITVTDGIQRATVLLNSFCGKLL
jgi:hypothetical protein